jgi:hypothetical protein
MLKRQVTCLNCGWVHMGMTKEQAAQEVANFNVYFAKLTPKEQQDYYKGRPSSIEMYIGCFRCKQTRFRKAVPGDCPDGCTIQPVVVPEELLKEHGGVT